MNHKGTSRLLMLLEGEPFLFCIIYMCVDKVMAKSLIFGLCHFPGCVALDIIGLIDMTLV